MLYPCYMMLHMWHKDLHPGEINPFLFISHWTTITSYGLVTLSCVRSLLRALFMVICHLLKGKWTKISQTNNQFTFAGIIHTNATVATTADMTWINRPNAQCALTLQNHNRIDCVIINWIDLTQFQPGLISIATSSYICSYSYAVSASFPHIYSIPILSILAPT